MRNFCQLIIDIAHIQHYVIINYPAIVRNKNPTKDDQGGELSYVWYFMGLLLLFAYFGNLLFEATWVCRGSHIYVHIYSILVLQICIYIAVNVYSHKSTMS